MKTEWLASWPASLTHPRAVADEELFDGGMHPRWLRDRGLEVVAAGVALEVAKQADSDSVEPLHERPGQIVVKVVDNSDAANEQGDIIEGISDGALRAGSGAGWFRRVLVGGGFGSRRGRIHRFLVSLTR